MPSRRAPQILKIPGAGKVELLGTQDEVIHLNFSTRHVAGLGLDQQAVLNSLQQQNAVAPPGVIQAGPEQVTLRVSGHFKSVQSLEAVNLRVNDRFFRLSDIATITRGYVDPPQPMFRFNGEPAIGIAIGMKANGNILQFGKDLRGAHARDRRHAADRRRRASGLQPAGGGRGGGRRLHQGVVRGRRDRAGA